MPLGSPLPEIRAAQKGGYCLGAFNVDNLPLIPAVVRAAEAESAPVIIELGPPALTTAGLDETVAVVRALAAKAAVPVALHLDHGRDLEQIEACIRSGFTSLMIDGSALAFDDNVRVTQEAAQLCHAYGLPLEAELGAIAGTEAGYLVRDSEAAYTDPQQAAAFVARTGCDLLAVSIGNVHYMSTTLIHMDFQRLQQIRAAVAVPLVLHGGAAVTDDDMRRAVAGGICKYNIAYKVQKQFVDGLAAGLAEMDERSTPGRLTVRPGAVIARGQAAAQNQVQKMIRILGGSGRVAAGTAS